MFTCWMHSLSLNVEELSGIYGIAKTPANEYPYLVKYNPDTGTSQTLTKPSKKYLTSGVHCLDTNNGILYYTYETNTQFVSSTNVSVGLYPYYLPNPSAITLNPIVLPVQATSIVNIDINCVGDESNGDIYIWGHASNETQTQYLYHLTRTININHQTNEIIKDEYQLRLIATYSKIDDTQPMFLYFYYSILDSKRSRLLVPATQGIKEDIYLYWINATSGVIIDQMMASDFELEDNSEYDMISDSIFTLKYWTASNGNYSYQLESLDPVTLNVNQNNHYPNITDWCIMWGSLNTIDIYNRVSYYIISQNPCGNCQNTTCTNQINHLLGFSLDTGDIVSNCIFKDDIPWAMQYWNGFNETAV